MRHACFRGHRRPDRIGGNAWRLAAVLLAGMAALAPAAAASWSTPPATGPGPRGIAIDDAGNVYTANFGSTGQPGAQAVTKITSSGVSLGECGSTNATGSGTGNPHSIAVGPTGDLFVTVFGKARVARISADCSVSTYDWGTTSTSPTELVIDPAGVVFVGNGGGDITRIVPGSPAVSSVWTTVANNPRGIGLDRAGNVYTASSDWNNTTRVRPDGTRSGTASLYTWALAGASPWGVAADDDGNIAVANTVGNSVTRIDRDGNVTCTAPLGAGSSPYGIAIDAAGNVYTANSGSNNVSRVTPACAVTALTGFGNGPFGIALDADGSIYTANNAANTVTRVTGLSGVAPAPPAIPSAPTAAAGPASATVTVTPRVSRRYGTPTSYVVRATQDPTRTCTITAPATSCEVTGLTGGSSYTFTAAARLEAWETAASAASNAVTSTAAPVNSALPSVTGTASVGETLSAGKGTWSATPAIPDPSGYTYQWQRCTTSSGGCTAITGATTATYVLQPVDAGAFVRVEVTAANGVAPNGVASSAAPFSGPVAAAAAPEPGRQPDAAAGPEPGPAPTPERRPLARPAVAILSATVQARSQIRVRINVNRAGTIRITGTHAAIRAGRAGEAIACRTAVTVTRAVTTTVTCPLRAATSRLLATRSLVIDLRAEFSAGSGTTKATARASRSIRIDRIAPSPDAVTG